MNNLKNIFFVFLCLSCATMKYTKKHESSAAFSKGSFEKPSLVTSGTATNFTPDLSPNGAYLLYSSDLSGNKDIWIKKIAKGSAKRLTYHTADDLSPTMSQNGKYVAFVSRRQDAAGDIHIMKLSGLFSSDDEERATSSFNLKRSEDTQPAWFSDSSRLVFTSRKPHQKTPSIMIASLDELTAKPLAGIYGHHPAPSKDGRYIAYSRMGSLYIYSLETQKEINLTRSSIVKDGQPSFSEDGRYLTFIRYADDTNQDGRLNGDDRPSIWQIDIEKWDKKTALPLLAAFPLSSAQFAAYNPKTKSPFVYFTMQTKDSLEVFRLPEKGHVQEVDTNIKGFLEHPKESLNQMDVAYYYRLRAHHLFMQGKREELQDYLLQKLYWFTQERKVMEASFVFAQIKDTFKEKVDVLKLAELMLLNLKISPITYPDDKKDPLDSVKKFLFAAKKAASQIVKSYGFQSSYREEFSQIEAMIEARILASGKDYFKALKILDHTFKKADKKNYITAKAQLLKASLIKEVMDKETAILQLASVIEKNRDDFDISRKASKDILSIVEKGYKDKIQKLTQIRDTYAHLEVLASLAHKAIVDHYLKIGERDVAINELRQLIYLYPKAPVLTIEMAKELSRLAPASSDISIDKQLYKFYENIKRAQNPRHAENALMVLQNYSLQSARSLYAKGTFEMALAKYQKVVATDSKNLEGHIGVMKSMRALGQLDAYKVRFKREDGARELEEYLDIYKQTYTLDNIHNQSDKLGLIDDLIEDLKPIRDKYSKNLRMHQTLGWLYFQRYISEKRYNHEGGFFANLGKRKDIVKSYFGADKEDWIALAINSYLKALFLAPKNSYQEADLNQNLAAAYFERKSYLKSLSYYVRRIKEESSFPFESIKQKAVVSYFAGRASFLLKESSLAASMFQRALESWESLDNEKEIARNLDYLGLSYLESYRYEKAYKMYHRLLEIYRRKGQKENEAIALLNGAYAKYMAKKYDEALMLYAKAEEILYQKDLDFKVNTLSGIEIPLAGGQASETQGFTLLTRKIQLETFRAEIYEKKKDYDLALEALIRKKNLELLKRKEGQDADRSDLYYTEEISRAYVKIAHLQEKRQKIFLATKAYYKGYEWARKRRDPKKNYMAKEEVKYFTDYLRSALNYGVRKKGSGGRKVYSLLVKEIDDLDKAVKESKKPLDVSFQLSKILPLKIQFEALLKLKGSGKDTYTNTNTERNTDARMRSILADSTKDHKTFQSNMLALHIPEKGSLLNKKQLTLLRDMASADENIAWRYYFAKGMWQNAYDILANTNFEKDLYPIKTQQDLLIYEKLFSYAFKQKANNLTNKQKFQWIANDLSKRYLYKSKLLSLKGKDNLIFALEPKDTPDIIDSLLESESLLMIHKMPHKKAYLVFTIIDNTLSMTKLSKITLNSLFPLLKKIPKNNHIYLIWGPDTHKLPFHTLKDYTFSYLLTPNTLPYAKEDTIKEAISVHDLGGSLKPLIDPYGPLEYHEGVDFNSPFLFSNFLHIGLPLYINKHSIALSRIQKSKKRAHEDLYLKDLSKGDLERLFAIIYARPIWPKHFHKNKDYNNLETIHLKSLAMEVFTTLIPQKISPKPEKWAHLYQTQKGRDLAQFARDHKITYFGIAPAPYSHSVAVSELERAMEDSAHREALYHARTMKKKSLTKPLSINLRDEALSDGDIKTALYYQKKHLHYTKDKKSSEYADELVLAGTYAIHAKDHKAAEFYFKGALKIYDREEDFAEAALCAKNLAINYERQDKYHEALLSYQKAKKYHIKDDDPLMEANIDLALGNLHALYFSDYTKALASYDKAILLFESEEEDARVTRALIDKANALIAIGQVSNAILILQKILKKISQDDVDLWVRTSQILTKAYFRKGQNKMAKKVNDEVMAKIAGLKGAKKVSYHLDATNIKALITAKMGDYKKAFLILKEGIETATSHNLRAKKAQRWNNLGFLYREQGRFRLSVHALEEALRIDRELGSESAMAYDLRNLALSIYLLGDLGRARSMLEKALKLSLKLNLNYNAAYSYFGLGDISFAEDKPQKALSMYKKAEQIARGGALFEFIWRAQAAIAMTYRKEKNNKEAARYFEASLATIESLRAGQKVTPSKTRLFSDLGIHDVYEAYALLLFNMGNIEKAFTVSERARSRGFIDSMASSQIVLKSERQNKALLKERLLRDQLDLLKRKAEKEKDRIIEKKSEYKKHIEKMTALNPHLKDLVITSFPSLEKLKAKIDEKKAILQYYLTKNNLLIFVLTKKEVKGVKVKVRRQVLKRKIKALRNLLNAYSTTHFVAKELSQILLEPASQHLKDMAKITIVPHSFLHHLSFALLPYEKGLLIDYFPIHYLDSAASYTKARDRKTRKKNPFVLAIGAGQSHGKKIPFAKKEVLTLKRYYKNAVLFTDKKATKENLFNNLSSKDIIHVAAHGTFDALDPLNSYLKLTGAGEDDGKLSVKEIFSSHIKADLVTMSSCESGMGKVSFGDEITGFNKALFFAGTRSIISALWRINDVASAVLMKRFYRYLSEGFSKDQALRKSQILVRQYFPHPSYWAAYRLTGEAG